MTALTFLFLFGTPILLGIILFDALPSINDRSSGSVFAVSDVMSSSRTDTPEQFCKKSGHNNNNVSWCANSKCPSRNKKLP